MPTLRELKESRLFRAICIGDTGTGKTGSLVEVINRMDELGLKQILIADSDQGTDILTERVKPEFLDRVKVQTFKDILEMNTDAGAALKGGALDAAWVKLTRIMSNWPDGVGPVSALGRDSLFVVDSLTGFGDAALNYAYGFNDRTKGDMWKSTGPAMGLQGKFIEMCVAVRCNFILMSHIKHLGGGGIQVQEDKKGSRIEKEVDSQEGTAYPSALGRNLPRAIAKDFNIMLEYKFLGNRRRINTVGSEDMALKLPIILPREEFDQATGLFEIMKAFLGSASAK